MGARFQIEKLNLIANPQNRKRPGTPINKSGAHIVMLFLIFRLVGRNIVLMKRFLSLLILMRLVSAQDVLTSIGKSQHNGKVVTMSVNSPKCKI